MGNTCPVAAGRKRLSLSWKVSLLIAFLLVASAIVTITFAFETVRGELYRQSREAASNVHSAVDYAIQADYNDIQQYRKEARNRRKAALRDVANPLIVSLDELRKAAQSGELTEQQAKTRALDLLKDVRFGKNDYFFTYDRGLTAISHPDPRFQGRNLRNLKDADGEYVLRKIRRVALQRGSGYVNYRWQRLNGQEPLQKMAYVFHYKPWDWIIGTGVYVDDIEADVQEQINDVRADLQVLTEDIKFQGDGFMFVLDSQGAIVAGADPVLLAASKTPEGQKLLQDLAAQAPTDPGAEKEVEITTDWSGARSNSWSLRLSTVGGDLDWVLVTAVPENRLEAPGRRLALQLVVLSVVVLLIGLALGLLISRRITKPVDDITAAARSLKDDTFDPTMLDASAARSDEVGDLARTFQSMGIEIMERERRLRQQVEQLTVQIDRARVAEEVEAITDTEYFQQLKARSEELRRSDD